jgi:hypothetical protein
MKFVATAMQKPIAKTPEAVYSVGNWGKDSLPITNCKLPIVKKPSDIAGGLFVWGREGF